RDRNVVFAEGIIGIPLGRTDMTMTAAPLDSRGPKSVADGAPAPVKVDVSHGVILYVEGVTVSFDGFKALNDLSFAIDAGELRCVIGPNGAGKTTMMDVITGKTRPDEGTVFLGQTIDLTKCTEYEIARLGVGRKFQKPSVFESHSVFENL